MNSEKINQAIKQVTKVLLRWDTEKFHKKLKRNKRAVFKKILLKAGAVLKNE